MTKFENREEYERWKAEKLKQTQEAKVETEKNTVASLGIRARKEANSMTYQTEESEGSTLVVDPKLAGIRGWLILPAIGFILSLINGVNDLSEVFDLFSVYAAAGYGGIYALMILAYIGFLVFLFYTVTLFFCKKRNAPSTIIILLIANIIVFSVFFVILLDLTAGAEEIVNVSKKELIRGVISAAIWIPYFRKSKRVKATFVN